MGAELMCTVRVKGATTSGKARLETEVLHFRGADVRLAIRFKDITTVVARSGMLNVTSTDGTASFAIGDAAPKWADKIRNPPSRLQKIGVKPEWTACAIGVDDGDFLKELGSGCARLSIDRAIKGCDAVFFGVTRQAELSRLEKLKASLKPNGALWIIRPKGRPEISERATMAAGKAAGLVDVKVVSFSATHTAEKFVIPVSARGALA
jgi:hypothetical protein